MPIRKGHEHYTFILLFGGTRHRSPSVWLHADDAVGKLLYRQLLVSHLHCCLLPFSEVGTGKALEQID